MWREWLSVSRVWLAPDHNALYPLGFLLSLRINAENRQMRNRSPGGLEIDESTLLGSSTQDSFAAR